MGTIRRAILVAALAALAACGDDAGGEPSPDARTEGGAADAGRDASAPRPASTDHCDYAPLPPTARAGGTVEPGPVQAGVAEAQLGLPVGSALGAYTARASLIGGGVPDVDGRSGDVTEAFLPSVGVETFPKARALALTAGEESVVILKIDLGVAFEGLPFDVADALGAPYHGKVIVSASHTHGGWGHFTGHSALQLGFDIFRPALYERLVAQLADVAQAALDDRRPARVGIAHEGNFDPDDRVSRDRRSENDHLPGGEGRKDHDLFVIRVDSMDGEPMAVLPIFGIHGTLLDADNNIATTDATGAIERALEERFDHRVLVMHLQGAAGDVSPVGHGGIDCPEEGPCYDFARAEGLGRRAAGPLWDAWEQAGADMRAELAMEMVTRSVPLGPNWETFTVRDGALRYAPFDADRDADGLVFDDEGAIRSPIDEFNAPTGAALCGETEALISRAAMPGVDGLAPYGSCMTLERATRFLGTALQLPFESPPLCGSTRTTLSALRIGDFVAATAPGEPLTLFADALREASPVEPERTIVLGFSQGHTGYLLTPEDWLAGGYEPSINLWGPLEAQYLLERSAELMQLVTTDVRENATEDGVARWATPLEPHTLGEPDPSPMAGTVPEAVPAEVYVRSGEPLSSAQPAATVERLGLARFAWIGEDPRAGTPRVTLQHETAPGSEELEPVMRRSGRAVRDGDLLLTWTPLPLEAGEEEESARTHHWVVEWQAVVPWGSAGLDAMEDKAGVALGRYRFHVEGEGYELSSEPFEVTPATLAVDARIEGSEVIATARYFAPDGWRLLTHAGDSNTHVPLWPGAATVELELTGGSTRTFDGASVGEGGEFRVDAGEDATEVVRVRVIDRFGNAGQAAP